MRALLKKELWPFLPPALIGALLFTVLYAVVFDVQDALLAPPSDLLPIAIGTALCMGGLLGYGQLAVERHGGTLAFLLHRDQPVWRVLAAKCLAGWALLAAVVHLPLLLFALGERWSSPLGPVVQWGRVGELWVAALACVPAHALGFLCATLRCAAGWRTALLLLFLGGIGLVITAFCLDPHAGPVASRLIYAAILLVVGALLLLAVGRELLLVEDADRPAPAGRLLSLGLPSLVLIGMPVSIAVTLAQQGIAVASGPASFVWREDVGLLRTMSVDHRLRAERIDGEPFDLAAFVGQESSSTLAEMELRMAGFERVTVGMSRVLPTTPHYMESRGRPSIAPAWEQVGAIDFRRLGDRRCSGGARAFFDAATGQVRVLHSTNWPEPKPMAGANTTAFQESPEPSLRSLVRGDGKPFSRMTLATSEDSSPRLRLEDPADGSAWSLDLGDPRLMFQRTEPSITAFGAVTTEEHPRIYSTVEGDRVAYTLRVLDRKTGETLLEESCGPLETGENRIPLLALELLHPPLAVLLAFRAKPSGPIWDTVHQAGVLSGYGRRPLLLLASFGFALGLAWDVQRRLSRRGAERWRRWSWSAALLLLGLQGWLVYMALERRALRPASRPAARRVLVQVAPVLE